MDIVYVVYKCTVSCKVPGFVFKLTTLLLVDKHILLISVYHSEFSGSRNKVVKIIQTSVQLDPLTFSRLMDAICFPKMPVTSYNS
jgi:hypothetical protein